jgi:hypothetical protein
MGGRFVPPPIFSRRPLREQSSRGSPERNLANKWAASGSVGTFGKPDILMHWDSEPDWLLRAQKARRYGAPRVPHRRRERS